MTDQRYTEGTCADGAGILKGGELMTIGKVIEELNNMEPVINRAMFLEGSNIIIGDDNKNLEAENAALRAKLGRVKDFVETAIQPSYTQRSTCFDECDTVVDGYCIELYTEGVDRLRDLLSPTEAPLAVVKGYCPAEDLPKDPWIYDCEDDECLGVFKLAELDNYGRHPLAPVTVIIMPKEWTDD